MAKERRLTIRSTGPYTACRHLARHFILGQIPPRCSGPVSSNVMRRPFKPSRAALRHEPRKSSLSVNVAFGRSRTRRSSPRTNIVLRQSFAFSVGCVRSKVCRAAPSRRLCCAHAGSRSESTVGANNRGFFQAAHNRSLNRTHCSVPSFGLKKLSPNADTPQRAG